jgi:translation initiation factor 1A
MPKNKGKGGKNRRRGKNENEEKRELIFKEDGQEYAQVLRMLGNGRLEAQCIDGVKRLCHIRGKMRKKVWVNQGDIVLVGLRDYQDAKGDVILKYMADEARSLKQYGELPENIRVNDTDAMMEGDENENAEYVACFGLGVQLIASLLSMFGLPGRCSPCMSLGTRLGPLLLDAAA